MKKFQILNWMVSIVFLLLLMLGNKVGYMQVLMIKTDMLYWTIIFPIFLIVFLISATTVIIKMTQVKPSVLLMTTLLSSIYWFFMMIFFDSIYMTASISLQWLLMVIGLLINIVPIGCILINSVKAHNKNKTL